MAAWVFADFVDRIKRHVQDSDAEDVLSEADLEDCLTRAVRIYEQHRPRLLAFTQSGNGSTYEWAMPSGWVDHFSTVRTVEMPTGEQLPVLHDQNEWKIVTSGTTTITTYFRFLHLIPNTGDTLRVEYTTIHILSSATNTIPETDQEALAKLASAEALEIWATLAARQEAPTIEADAVDYTVQGRQIGDRAKLLRGQYMAHVGRGGDGTPAAAMAFTDWDTQPETGRYWVWHKGRTR